MSEKLGFPQPDNQEPQSGMSVDEAVRRTRELFPGSRAHRVLDYRDNDGEITVTIQNSQTGKISQLQSLQSKR